MKMMRMVTERMYQISTASVEEGARTGEADTVPNYENMQKAEKQQQKQPN